MLALVISAGVLALVVSGGMLALIVSGGMLALIVSGGMLALVVSAGMVALVSCGLLEIEDASSLRVFGRSPLPGADSPVLSSSAKVARSCASFCLGEEPASVISDE